MEEKKRLERLKGCAKGKKRQGEEYNSIKGQRKVGNGREEIWEEGQGEAKEERME